jgi:hypothetical protein
VAGWKGWAPCDLSPAAPMNPEPPVLSVIIPAFNRAEPLKYTLRTVAEAARRLAEPVEVLVIDDGSVPPTEEQLAGFAAGIALTHRRQANQGCIAARTNGLAAARGEFILFLDSDDLVHPDKFRAQVAAMRASASDVSYADMATATRLPGYAISGFTAVRTPTTADPIAFYIGLQPAVHDPIYRREYLVRGLRERGALPPRSLDAAGDVWNYFNLALLPARITKVEQALSAPGPHEEERFSQHWEKLAVPALLAMELFLQVCPPGPETAALRSALGAAAFRSWRGLPHGFNRHFARRMLAIYQQAPRGPLAALGTPNFARLARAIGPLPAARLLRAVRRRPYARLRTLSGDEYRRLFANFGPAPADAART